MKISVCEFTAKIVYNINITVLLNYIHTYIHTLYTYETIYEVGVFFFEL